MEKVVLVTGANRGIGLEVVKQLVAKNFTVILSSRNAEKGKQAAKDLGHANVVPRQLDVADQESIGNLVTWLTQAYGRLDVLVNNAGINYDTYQNVLNADLDNVRDTFETNLLGTWRVTQALLPLLRKSAHGRIVNVSSGAGTLDRMTGGTPAYSLSKLALNGLTLMLASSLKTHGILVNAVTPGWVATDMGGVGGRPVEEGAASVVWAVTLNDDGPTGELYRDGKQINW